MPVVFPKFCFQYANSRTAAKDRQESQFCGSPVYVFFLMLKTTPRKGDISKVKPSLFSLNTPSALRRVFVVFQFAMHLCLFLKSQSLAWQALGRQFLFAANSSEGTGDGRSCKCVCKTICSVDI